MSALIDTAFVQIAQDHDCTHVQLHYGTKAPQGYTWSVTLHWDGFSRTYTPCKTGYGDTPAIAFANALINMRLDREPFTCLSSDTIVDFEKNTVGAKQ